MDSAFAALVHLQCQDTGLLRSAGQISVQTADLLSRRHFPFRFIVYILHPKEWLLLGEAGPRVLQFDMKTRARLPLPPFLVISLIVVNL